MTINESLLHNFHCSALVMQFSCSMTSHLARNYANVCLNMLLTSIKVSALCKDFKIRASYWIKLVWIHDSPNLKKKSYYLFLFCISFRYFSYRQSTWQSRKQRQSCCLKMLTRMTVWLHTLTSTVRIYWSKHENMRFHQHVWFSLFPDRFMGCTVFYRDQVAFITGGGSGIGLRIAEIFMRWEDLPAHLRNSQSCCSQ